MTIQPSDNPVTEEQPEQERPQVSNKERTAVYTEALARLRTKYRAEFDGYLVEGYRKIGLDWTPRPNEVQKARNEIERLLSEHPELRQLFAVGNDPANRDAT